MRLTGAVVVAAVVVVEDGVGSGVEVTAAAEVDVVGVAAGAGDSVSVAVWLGVSGVVVFGFLLAAVVLPVDLGDFFLPAPLAEAFAGLAFSVAVVSTGVAGSLAAVVAGLLCDPLLSPAALVVSGAGRPKMVVVTG